MGWDTIVLLPMKVISVLNILGIGLAAVCLGEGPISIVEYKTEKDGNIPFNEVVWEEFLTGKGLKVGTPVLITIRNDSRNDLLQMG